MKPNSSPEKVRRNLLRRSKQRGFALVISLSLMVLLTVLSVGLLTLSTLSLRSSGQSEAMEVARSNARMALSIAIGQLQKTAGPDQRITAPASFENPQAPKGLTGVWKGALPSENAPVPDKDNQFLTHLVSGNEEGPNSAALPDTNGPILLGEGSLGKDTNPDQFIRGTRVESPLEGTGIGGRYAWTVLDEGMKAKADIVREEGNFGDANRQVAMGAPARFGMEGIDTFDQYDWFGETEQAKLYTLSTGALIEQMPELGRYQHDITTVHNGLATDPARGGLKKDLSLLLGGTTLPSDYAAKRVYDEDSAENEAPNPYWTQIFDYANLYRNLSGTNPQVKAFVPPGYNPVKYDARSRTYKANPMAPRGLMLMPVVAKVQMQFSMVAKQAHGPWSGGVDKNPATAADNYMVYMIYSPIVTLYNPYNVPLSFDELRIDFKDIPIGFRFYKNGTPMTRTMAHMNQLYVGHDGHSKTAKTFGLNLRNNFGATRSGPVVMQPGENRVFGESVDGNLAWGSATEHPFFDYADNRTSNLPLAPGYPSQGVGFWIDWLTPDDLKFVNDGWGVFPITLSDSVDVGFAPMPSQASDNRLSIDLQLVRGSQRTRSGTLELDYGSEAQLRESLSQDDSSDFSNGEQRLQRPYKGSEMFESTSTKLKDFVNAKAFAKFSFYAKTTREADEPSKPWVQGGQVTSLSGIDLSEEAMGIHPFEVSMRRLAPSYKFPIDAMNRGQFFTGHGIHSSTSGTTIAPQYEIPLLPLQSLAQLRHAQLCNQGFLPGANYTVGESFASPMIPPGNIMAGGTKGYPLLDHAWLANNTLWDGYFLSTLSPQTGPVLSSRPLASVAEDFFNGTKPLLNPRMVPAGNTSPAETVQELLDDDGYLKSAAHLMIDGAFNVNSTSVNAWIAFLSSMNKETVEYWHVADGAAQAARGEKKEASNPFSRMRRAGGPPVEDAPALQGRHARWTGMRTLEKEQIEELATHIVQEIKNRGPFLSLAEFVNRQPGSDREMAREGLLQKAIDLTTSINEDFANDSVIITTDMLADRGYPFPEALTGMSATGAPGYLTQGDILSALGSVVTVRSDTFRIRAYGEAVDKDGKVLARAWCEAVVQRLPEFVDPEDAPETLPADLNPVNETFGRRFQVTGFRWLGQDEV